MLAVGCQRPAQPELPTVARVSVDSPERVDVLYDAATKALLSNYLPPDREDRTEGVIISRPETSAAWFEFWRPQPQPGYYWWESNLHPIRRQATISIKPVAGGEYDVNVEIERSRYSLEERQVDNPAAALRLYSNAAPTRSGKMQKPGEGGHWIPLGRDQFAEQRVLSDILKRYGGSYTLPAEEAPTTQPTQVGLSERR